MCSANLSDYLFSSSLCTFRPLPKHVLSYLACACLGQFRHNLNLFANHEPTDPRVIPHPFDDVLTAGFGIRLYGNERFGPLTPLFIT